MRRVTLAAAAAVLIVTGSALTGAAAPVKHLPPCEYEDSSGPCYWDAAHRGNGIGRSFWIDAHQRYHYIKH